MTRTVTVVSALALAAAVPAWAAKPPHPTHPTQPTHASSGKNAGCTAHNEGFRAYGTLTASALTAGTSAGRYNGTLTVDVTKANHGAPTGSQTFTLTNARVRFGKGVDLTAPASGDRVTLHGKITELPHGCSTTGFTPTITVRDVTIKVAHKHA
jgi:ribosomal protein L31